MKRMYIILAVGLIAGLVGPPRAGGQEEPLDESLRIPLEPYAPGAGDFYFFIHRAAGRDVGYSELTLLVQGKDSKRQYRYRHFTDIITQGERLTTNIDSLLTPGFSPVEIRVRQAKVSRKGVRTDTMHVTVVEKDEIVITKTENGKSETRRVPRPPDRFVYGLALLITRMDFDKFEDFSLAELDPKTGTAFRYTFNSDVGPDQTRVVRATWGVEGRAYYFTLDPSRRLSGWGQVPPAVTARMATIQQVAVVKKDLGLEDG